MSKLRKAFALWALAGVVGIAGSVGAANAVDPGVTLEAGWEWFRGPEVRFAHRQTNIDWTIVEKLRTSSGQSSGSRLDGALGMYLGWALVGIKGFYSLQDQGTAISCQSNAAGSPNVWCSDGPLIDPNPTVLNFTLGNPFQSRQTYVTDLDRTHWGVALEWQSDTIKSFSESLPIAYKIGIAYRRVDQQMHITGTETFSTARVTYAEKLDTSYLGAYVGFIAKLASGAGWVLTLDGEGGLYWATTDYRATYLGEAGNSGAGNAFNVLSLNDNGTAFIGSIKLALDKDFGAFKLGFFGRGEFLSTAPQVSYNDIDRFIPFSTFGAGGRDGTVLKDATAWTLSSGVRVSVPF